MSGQSVLPAPNIPQSAEHRSEPERDGRLLLEQYQRRLEELEMERDRLLAERHADNHRDIANHDSLMSDYAHLADDLACLKELRRFNRAELLKLIVEQRAWTKEKTEMEDELAGWKSGKPDYSKLKEKTHHLAETYRKKHLDSEIAIERLVERNRVIQEELKDVRRQYSAAWDKTIEVLHELAAPPSLPIEILVNVAAFVAGSNSFRTLAAMCSTSRLMLQEIQPTLYETLIFDDYLFGVLVRGKHAGTYPAAWKYTRFVVLENWYIRGRQERDTVFPNLCASFAINMNPELHFSMEEYEEVPPKYTAELDIRRNVTLATLSSILKYPLDWSIVGERPSRSTIRGISQVSIDANASLTRGHCNVSDLFSPTECGPNYIFISRDTEDGAAEPERMQTSIRAVSQFLLRPGPHCADMESRRLQIHCNHPSDVESWLLELPNYLALNPYIDPHIGLNLEHEITAREFIDYAHRFEAMYKSIWAEVYAPIDRDSDWDIKLFELFAYPPEDDDADERFKAVFTRLAGWSGFHVKITEDPPVPESQGAAALDQAENNTVALDEHHYLPGGQLVPTADDDRIHADLPSDDDNASDEASVLSASDARSTPDV